MKMMKLALRYLRPGAAFFFAACLAASIAPPTLSRQSSGQGAIPLEALRRAPGELLVEGQNKTPVGELRVKSYRLEEIRLSTPVRLGGDDSRVLIESAIRLSVTGGPFNLGSYTIWIDDLALPAAPANNNTELSTLIYGPATFSEGATISVSHGTGCNTDMESVLPEKLTTPARLRSRRAVPQFDASRVKLSRVASGGPLGRSAAVAVTITNPAGFEIRNAPLVLQIGRREFPGGVSVDPHKAGFLIPEDDFARLKDGSLIKVKYGLCQPGGEYITTLDKSFLDR